LTRALLRSSRERAPIGDAAVFFCEQMVAGCLAAVCQTVSASSPQPLAPLYNLALCRSHRPPHAAARPRSFDTRRNAPSTTHRVASRCSPPAPPSRPPPVKPRTRNHRDACRPAREADPAAADRRQCAQHLHHGPCGECVCHRALHRD
jgi:hypothetical protein